MNIVLVGGGQLGSRHLQALKKIATPAKIYVVEPSINSQQTCLERYNQVQNTVIHELTFVESSQQLKGKQIDYAIIATTSGVRFKATRELLENVKLKNLLLEKVLFPEESEYLQMQELITNNSVRTYVNCCMRMQSLYNQMKTTFGETPVHYRVCGSNYGMVTNAIHYIDHWCFLNSQTEFTLNLDGLINKLFPSKRSGYFEVNGTVTGLLDSGASLTLECSVDGSAPPLIEVFSQQHRFIIKENEDLYWYSGEFNGWKWEEKKLGLKFQSNLTNEFIENLNKGEEPGLPEYSESADIHLNLLRPLKTFCKKIMPTDLEFPFT